VMWMRTWSAVILTKAGLCTRSSISNRTSVPPDSLWRRMQGGTSTLSCVSTRVCVCVCVCVCDCSVPPDSLWRRMQGGTSTLSCVCTRVCVCVCVCSVPPDSLWRWMQGGTSTLSCARVCVCVNVQCSLTLCGDGCRGAPAPCPVCLFVCLYV